MNDVPIVEGDEYIVEIYAIGEKGDGIAKINNFVVIVPNTKLHELIKIRIDRVLSKFAFGKVVK